MRSLFKSLAVLTLVGIGRGNAVGAEKRSNTTLQAPIVAPVSEVWYVSVFWAWTGTDRGTGKELMELGRRSRFESEHPSKSTESYL